MAAPMENWDNLRTHVGGGVHSSLDWPEDEWDKLIKTNLTGLWLVAKHVCRRMHDAKLKGSLINISSVAGVNRGHLPGSIGYTSSKSAVHYATKLMALELGAFGIRVNSIAPGIFKSEITAPLLQKRWLNTIISKIVPLKTNGTTDPALTSLALFSVGDDDKEEADRVFERYAVKRVRDMMYQARVDTVKKYYENHREKLDDALARPRELSEEQYLEARLDWCKEEDWPNLCHYWVTEHFKEKRRKGQQSRLESEDVAQNRGGSRPFVETQQFLEQKFGPNKVTGLNTYAVMKSGIKNVDSSGSSAAVSSQKAQQHMDNYQAALNSSEHPEDSEQHDFDGKVLYTIRGGLPHGHVLIGNGAVKKADVIAAAKGRNIRPSNTPSYRALLQENAQLHQRQEVQGRMIMLGEEPPAEMMCRQPPSQVQGTGSSHVGSQVAHEILDEEIGGTQAVDGNMDGEDNGNTIFHVSNNDAADNAGVDQANNGTS